MSDDEYNPENSDDSEEDSSEESEEELSEEEQEMLEEYARNLNKRQLEKDEDNNSNKKNKQEFEDLFRFIIINMNNPLPINSCTNFNTLSGEEDKTLSQETQETDKSLDTLQEPVFGPSLPISKTNQSLKFDKTFDTLLELINLGETYDPSIEYDCNINMEKLHRIIEPLKELNNMIGLDKFKKSIIDQIVYILTLSNLSSTDDKPMLHTCIYGPPGCGKTQTSTILAKIYSSCGLLSGNKFRVVKREDFVAGYLGQTAIKTKKLLESMLGGVLFLDEAYSMGSLENRDYFAKEAIDTLNVFLSENYANFILIIAGYEKDIKECFFAQNSGLERRFPYRFTIDGYSSSELSSIFSHFVSTNGWKLSPELTDSIDSNYLNEIFSQNMKYFPFYAGDVKTFFDKCKICHTKKLILLDKSQWKFLTKKDINEGFTLYLQERPIEKDAVPFGMYL